MVPKNDLKNEGEENQIQRTVYKMRIPMNCINEYIIMYLNKPNDVTKAQRPSRIKCLMQLIFSSLDVNGAATDASAWNRKQRNLRMLEPN